MKFSYKFNNVLGSVYDRANLQFFPDGTSLLSPCGNKIIVYDLKNGKSEALPYEIQYNICRIAISPDSAVLLIVTEKNQLMIASMIGNVILHRKDFKQIGESINDLKFSPDGKYYAVCGSSKILVYLTPGYIAKGKGRQISAFKIHKIIQASYEESTSISWNSTSQLLLVTSQDFSMKIYPIDRKIIQVSNFLTLTAHNDLIIGSFFANTSTEPLNIYSISRNGQLFVWKSNIDNLDSSVQKDEIVEKLNYTIKRKKYLFEDLKEKNSNTKVTTYAYESKTKLMLIAYNDGTFMLYDMTDIVLIHSLQLSVKCPITSAAFNHNGAWIAIGSSVGYGTKYDFENETSTQTQLIVWEWQSESFILKQSGYANSVTNSYECLAYSPDASLMITGGTDGRIKVWNLYSGFCISTFATEHRGPITGVEFVPGKDGKVFISCSLDGTLKAFDLNRYRCFRTLAAPSESKPAQFICLAIDEIGGDFIAAGSHNFFEIFLWSLKTGRLLEMLSGHEGPVSSLKFSPNSNTLYSCSWDCTVRIWNLFEGPKCTREVIKMGSDALSLEIREDGHQFAVATLNGNISFFNAQTGDQLGVGIEGKEDLGLSRYKNEEVNDKYKYFSTFCYSVDGEYILAAGKSKFICIYNVKEKLLVKKFTISNNLSLDGFQEFINKRKIQEFGFNLEKIKYRNNETANAPIALPGVIKSDFADRELTPVIAVHQIRFSPTMRSFALASTEGVILYSLDNTTTFYPYALDASTTTESFKKNLNTGNYTQALIDAIKLNDFQLMQESIENTPIDQIDLLISSLSITLIQKLLEHLAKAFETTKHIEFYLKWIVAMLSQHGSTMKSLQSSDQIASLRRLHQSLTIRNNDLTKIVDYNRYNFKFLEILSNFSTKNDCKSMNDDEMESMDSGMDLDEDDER